WQSGSYIRLGLTAGALRRYTTVSISSVLPHVSVYVHLWGQRVLLPRIPWLWGRSAVCMRSKISSHLCVPFSICYQLYHKRVRGSDSLSLVTDHYARQQDYCYTQPVPRHSHGYQASGRTALTSYLPWTPLCYLRYARGSPILI